MPAQDHPGGDADGAGLSGVLRHRLFRAWLGSNAVSLVGSWSQRTTVGWLIWTETQSTAMVGLIVFLELVPTLLLALHAGALADRANKAVVIRNCHLLSFLAAAGFAGTLLAGLPVVACAAAYVIVNGTLVATDQPARMAIVRDLVPPALVPAAVALNSVVFNTARLLGPPLAAVLILRFGGWAGIAVYALMVLPVAAVMHVAVRPHLAGAAGAAQAMGLRAAGLLGLRHILETRFILALIVLQTMLGLCVRPVLELMPAIVGLRFGGDAALLALLTSAAGVGAIAGGVLVSLIRRTPALVRAMWVASFAVPLCAVALPMATAAPASAAAALCLGFALVVSGVSTQSLLQLRVRPDLLGRVLGIYGVVFRGVPAFGALAIGLLADRIGLAVAVALFGLVVWASSLLIIRWSGAELSRVARGH